MVMTHAWSTDPARDAAVRAAEDGRTGPLPTLEQCIEGMIPKTASGSSPVDHENKGDCMATDGLRTERVTLQVTHKGTSGPVSTWPFGDLLDCYDDGESVRVVDEDREAADRVSREEGYRVLLDEVLAAREESDAAIRERDKLQARVAHLEDANRAMKDAADTASGMVDDLNTRVAGMEAANGGNLQAALDGSQAASGGNSSAPPNGSQDESVGGVIRDMVDIIEGSTADADEKHAAMVTLVEAVCPGWVLTQAASGGGEGEPVADAKPFAWAVVEKGKDAAWCYAFRSDRNQAQREFSASDFSYFPVYRSPPKPRGWLTEDERNGLDEIATYLDTLVSFRLRGLGIMVRNLLARSTPPKLVLPEPPFASINVAYSDWMMCLDAVKKALAAAGVAVKEVGRE
jgi:hypothetical protein